MPSRSLFPVELPALTFDSRSLILIKWSTAAERLFRRRFAETSSISAVELLLPPTRNGWSEEGGTRIDKLRERLARSVEQSERLPWGQYLTMEYFVETGQDSQPEKADVLVSLRQIDGFSSFSILFLRPSDHQTPLSPSLHYFPDDSANTKSFVDQLLATNGNGKREGDSGSSSSVRSASFSSADKRHRPIVGKEREKLPLSAETTNLLSHATSRVQADNSSNPSTSTLPASSVSLDNPPLGSKVVENMHQLFTNSPVYEQAASKTTTEMEIDGPESIDESEQPEPTTRGPSRDPLSFEEVTELIETQPQVTFVTDEQGQVTWLNDAWYRYTGFDNRYHLTFDTWMSCFHPDDLPNALGTYMNGLKSGEPFAFEYRIRHRDGNMRWNVLHARPKKDAEGKVTGLVCSIFDQEDVIQARHSALLIKERIKAVLEASQTLLISVNADLEIDLIEGSLSLPDILSTSAQSSPIHCHLQDLLHADELTEAARKILDEEESEVGLDHEFTSARGQKYYVRFRLVPVRGDPSIPATSPDYQAVTGVIIVGVNVTEAIIIEAELQKTRLEQVELESREKAKTDFLTTMSHELRTPTAQILGVLELVLGDKENPLQGDHRSLLEQAIRSGDALLELIGAVLDVRKVEAGQLKLETQPFLLSEVIEDARLFSVTSQAKGLRFQEEIGDFYQGTVLGDRLRLRQVLTNALSNAVKFTSKGTIVLRVRQTSETDTQLWIQVEVEDSGVGIEENVLPTLFQPFRQAHAGTAREFGGTGLGLVISKKLVELMNGQVELVSEYGRGSIFKILFPLSKAPFVDVKGFEGELHPVPAASAQEAAQIDKTNEVVAEARKRRRPEDVRVLLAEDNKLIREIVSRTLRGMKFHIDAVEDGSECLAQLEKEAYDIILMDGQMPRLDGYEAARLIKQNPRLRNIRIIALTASAISGDKERCLAAGMDCYLAKPVRSNDLQRTIFEQIDILDSLSP
ncbi:hypothetical protein JCM3765_000088 [Sporobolomyces pararoseus]